MQKKRVWCTVEISPDELFTDFDSAIKLLQGLRDKYGNQDLCELEATVTDGVIDVYVEYMREETDEEFEVRKQEHTNLQEKLSSDIIMSRKDAS